MIKIKGIFAVSLIVLMTVLCDARNVAAAAIASQDYVDQEVGTRLSAISGSTSGTGNVVTSVTASGGTVTATKGITAEETSNKTQSIAAAASASDKKYPSEKAVATALAAKADSADLADVATSGSYNDLTDKPSIPSAYTLPAATSTALGGVKSGGDISVATDGTVTVNSATAADTATKATQDGNGATISSTYTKIAQGSGNANKAVITNASGNITTGTITSAMITDGTITNADISSSAAIAASKISGLSGVATSGSYNDLTDKPSIPTAITVDSELNSTSTNPVQNKVINSALSGKLATSTYNSQIGTVSATNMGTSATTVVSAIKEVATEAETAQTTATAAQNAINALDVSTATGSGNVVTSVTQTNGKISVSKGNVQIPVGSATATSYATIWVE